MSAEAQTGPALLSARGISVRFGGLKALSNVDVEVPEASIVGLIGPNGAGKTTLINVLSGFVSPDDGIVELAGRKLRRASPQVRARHGLGRTFQHADLFSGLSVREHLLLSDRLRHNRKRVWRDALSRGGWRQCTPEETGRVDGLLSALGLDAFAERPVEGLPLGIGKLVDLGRALATEPRVLLLDEPCAGLDSGESKKLASTLERVALKRGVGMLLVEHDLETVLELSSRIYVLDFGVCIAAGTPAAIRQSPEVQAAYMGDQLVASEHRNTDDV